MKRFRTDIFLLAALSVFLYAVPVVAQQKADTLRQKHNESVTIYGSSRPRTGQALKVERKPQVPTLTMPSMPRSSGFPEIEVPTFVQPAVVKPTVHFPAIQPSSVWNNLLTLGLGSRISPLLEYFYSGGKPKKHQLTVHLLHHSSFLNIKDYLPSPYTHSQSGIRYDRYFRYHVLSVYGDYRIRTLRYYGFNTKGDTLQYDTKDASLKQYYQVVSFGVKYGSSYRYTEKLQHVFRATGYQLSDKHGLSETNLLFNFDLHKGFRVSHIFNHQQLGLEGGFAYFRNRADFYYSRSVHQDYYVRLFPYFDARYGIFSFKVGMNFAWLKQYNTKLHFYPYLHVNVNVAPGVFSFFGGIQGGVKKNSLLNLSRENPYLYSSQNSFRWENTKLETFGGIRGNVARHFGFEFRVGYRSFSDMAYFDHENFIFYTNVTNSAGKYLPFKNAFYVYYTDGHVVDISGSLTYGNVPHLDLWLKGEYHHYSLQYGQKPFYKPLFTSRLGASYSFEKIKPWLEIYYMGHRWAARYTSGFYMNLYPIFGPPEYKMDSYFDVNLGLDYQINKQLSGFLRVTNLLNKQYFRFDGYPVAGLEVMVGVRYRF
jgi:hypothetical protein